MHSFFNILASIGTEYSIIIAILFAIIAIEFIRNKIHQLDFRECYDSNFENPYGEKIWETTNSRKKGKIW